MKRRTTQKLERLTLLGFPRYSHIRLLLRLTMQVHPRSPQACHADTPLSAPRRTMEAARIIPYYLYREDQAGLG